MFWRKIWNKTKSVTSRSEVNNNNNNNNTQKNISDNEQRDSSDVKNIIGNHNNSNNNNNNISDTDFGKQNVNTNIKTSNDENSKIADGNNNNTDLMNFSEIKQQNDKEIIDLLIISPPENKQFEDTPLPAEDENPTANWQPPNNNNNDNNNNNIINDNKKEEKGGEGRTELTKSLVEYLENNAEQFVRCPSCSTYFENAGEGNDPIPERLKGEELNHYNIHRFRCRHCNVEFCSGCGRSPYHVGYTCKAYEDLQNATKCRFCKDPILIKPNNRTPPTHCEDCDDHARNVMQGKFKRCGHEYGFHNDMQKLVFARSIRTKVDSMECTHPDCAKNGAPNDDDLCPICCVDEISARPWMMSQCGHRYHHDCVMYRMKSGWGVGPINFKFLRCPICDQRITFLDSIHSYKELQTTLTAKVKLQLQQEKIQISSNLNSADHLNAALAKLNYFECFKCKQPYFGGLRDCGIILSSNKEDYLCSNCKTTCPEHGTAAMIYKCRFCCSEASFFCFGHTHFCSDCHSDPWKFINQEGVILGNLPVCKGASSCKLKIEHPPNGEEFPLYCSLCHSNNNNNVKE